MGMVDHKISQEVAIAETRAKRLQMIVEGYEVYDDGMPDSTVPGAASPMYGARPERRIIRHPRYVLVTQYDDKGNYRLHLGENLANIEQIASFVVTSFDGGEAPVCYFDLDVLAGPEPRPCEGDKVVLTDEGQIYINDKSLVGETFYVVGAETDTFDGEAYEKFYISRNENAEYLSGEYDALIDEQYVEVVESAYEDERMPVRYGLAKIVTQVVFNTIPTDK